jgi:hypothetical protein
MYPTAWVASITFKETVVGIFAIYQVYHKFTPIDPMQVIYPGFVSDDD